MAHVGKAYPFFFYRDWSPPQAGFVNRLPWQYRMTGGVAPPGPFAGWANKVINSEIPTMDLVNREVCWEFLPPSGADPTTGVKIYYKLTYAANFFTYRWEGLIGGAVGIEGGLGLAGTSVDDVVQVGLGIIHVPPWPPASPVFSIVGRYRAATWSQLGVTTYPGYPI